MVEARSAYRTLIGLVRYLYLPLSELQVKAFNCARFDWHVEASFRETCC
jgi:hypothetical protein